MGRPFTDPRYYVSVLDDGTYQLTELRDDKAVSYPLPQNIPGLAQQLAEWRKWRDMLALAVRSSPADHPNRVAFADALGEVLTAEGN